VLLPVCPLSGQNRCQASMELANSYTRTFLSQSDASALLNPDSCGFWGMALTMGSGEIRSWLLVCACEAPQLLTPTQDDIDLDALPRLAALLVNQKALPV
jgi:hypothetical protein